jgi:hypothetical protein
MSTVSTRVHIRMPFVVGVLGGFLREIHPRDFRGFLREIHPDGFYRNQNNLRVFTLMGCLPDHQCNV